MKFKFQSAALAVAAIIFNSGTIVAQYPTTVTTENETVRTFKLSDGETVVATPRWIQTLDWQKDKALNYECFAVGGGRFYIADRSSDSPRILQFNAETGLYEREITVDFGNFNQTDLGHLGNDDFGNIYISSSFRKDNHDHYKANGLITALDDAVVSVIDQEGKVVRQWTLLEPKVNYSKKKKESFIADVSYDRICVRGNIMTGDNLIATMAVRSVRPEFITWYTPNVFSVVDTEKNEIIGESPYRVGIDFSNPSTFYNNLDNLVYPEGVNHDQTDVSYNPVFWKPGLLLSEYEPFTDYFYAIASIAPHPQTFRMSSTFEDVRYSKIVGNGLVPENSTTAAGAIGFSYAGHTLMACPYILDDKSINCVLSEYEIMVDHENRSLSHEASVIASFPEKTPLKSTAARNSSTIVALDNGTEMSPKTDLYIYAPGRGVARYTLADKAIEDGGQTSVGSFDASIKEFEVSGRNVTALTDCRLIVTSVDGRVLDQLNMTQNEMIALDLVTGIYIIKSDKMTAKICLR